MSLRESSKHVPAGKSAVAPDLSLSASGEHPVAMEISEEEEEEEAAAEAEEWKAPLTLFSTLWNVTAWYADKPYLGRRSGEGFSWMSYAEVWAATSHLGAGLLHEGLLAQGEHYAVCGGNCPEWAVADFAAAQWSFVSVPLVVTLDDETLEFCLTQAEVRVALVTCAKLEQFLRVRERVPLLRAIVVLDGGPQAPSDGVYSMQYVQAQGERHSLPYPEDDPSALWSLVYTSGSTGMPKGAMMTRERWNRFITAGYLVPKTTRFISFAPLAHVAERQTLYIVGFYGGQIGSYGGDMSALFDDIQILKPTYISCPPRIYNQIYAEYKAAVDQEVQRVGETERWKVELALLDRFRSLLGGEVEFLVTGSAPTSEAVKRFIERCYQVTVYDGYGTTECGGIGTDGVLGPDVDVRLEDVPELGYLSSNKPPQGEILVKTKHMISGYWKNEAKTAESFTEDGYFRTGDIGEMPFPGECIIIDRRKNIFKTAQGEFVAPAKLEKVYLSSALLDQICVCGNPLCSSVVAVVVPNATVLLRAMESTQDLETFLADPKQREMAERLILADLSRLAARAGLQGYEMPSRLLLLAEEMTAANGLLTPSMKLKRNPIHKRFGKELEPLWDNPLAPMDATEGAVSLKQMLSAVLNVPECSLDAGASFLSHGGDSLSAVRLAAKIRETYNREVPLSIVLQNPSLAQLSSYLEGDPEAAPELPAAALADLRMNTDCRGKASESAAPFSAARHILLTGATGFLGAFTLRALLRHRPDVTITCVVRGKHASERLFASLEERGIVVDAVDKERVRVVSGDIAEGLLGQTMKEYNRLCREMEAVVHCAAHVNWMLSYESLRSVNVAVLLDLVRLCSTHTLKTLVHVSTISCAPSGMSPESGAWEEYEGFTDDASWAAMLGPYGQSKWVAEHVLRQAAGEAVPWVCFRPAFISADRETGSGNLTDFVHRYLHVCVTLGVYIESTATRNLTPVDYVADSLLQVASALPPHRAYHASNNASPTYAGLGAALAKAGYAVQPVDYAEFRRRMLEWKGEEPLQLYGLLPMFGESDEWLFDRRTQSSVAQECAPLSEEEYARWFQAIAAFLPPKKE